LSPSQQQHAPKANGQAHDPREGRFVPQPKPGDNRAKQGHRRVQDGGKTGGDVKHRKGIQGKGDTAVERPDKEHRLPVLTQHPPMTFGQHDRQQKSRGNGHPDGGRGQGTQFDGG
jgi:hypothetical protein